MRSATQRHGFYILRASIPLEASTHARFAATLAPSSDLPVADHHGALDRPPRDRPRALRGHAAPGLVAGRARDGAAGLRSGARFHRLLARQAAAAGLELLAVLSSREWHPPSRLGYRSGL